MKPVTTEQIVILKNVINGKYKDKDLRKLVFDIVHHMLFISNELLFDFSSEKEVSKALKEVMKSNKNVAMRIVLHFWDQKFKKEHSNVSSVEIEKAFELHFETEKKFGETLLGLPVAFWKKYFNKLVQLIKEPVEVNNRSVEESSLEQFISGSVRNLTTPVADNMENTKMPSSKDNEFVDGSGVSVQEGEVSKNMHDKQYQNQNKLITMVIEDNESLNRDNGMFKMQNESLEKDVENLKKDVELLKKDNEILKHDNEFLKKDIELLKKNCLDIMNYFKQLSHPEVVHNLQTTLVEKTEEIEGIKELNIKLGYCKCACNCEACKKCISKTQ